VAPTGLTGPTPARRAERGRGPMRSKAKRPLGWQGPAREEPPPRRWAAARTDDRQARRAPRPPSLADRLPLGAL